MRDRERTNRRYAMGTAVVIAGLLALSLVVFLLRPAQLDPQTLCPTTRPLEGHTVVIIDRTDRWAPEVGETLRDIIESAQRETQQYQKFSIVSLDADQQTRPLFSVCNPGAPNFWSDLYRGRRYTENDFEQHFVGAAERVIEQVREPAQAETSPIVEYIHRWLGGDDFNTSVESRRLILISDMRQNSPLYSIYSEHGGAGLAPVAEHEFGPAAQGVVFDVYFIAHGQEHGVSEDAVRTAWDNVFSALGVTHMWRQIN